MTLRIATFQCDVTPEPGAALCHGGCTSALRIVDRLTARGVIILSGEDGPIVLCAVDWVAIAGKSHDAWRDAIAGAVGTTRDRVTVHTLHQHDAPGSDLGAGELLEPFGLAEAMSPAAFERDVIQRVAQAAGAAVSAAQPVTHVALGKARVDRFASNRRLLGPDGKVRHVRYSSCRSEEVRGIDEGVIDPFVRLVAFWRDEVPIASLTYYATHPQSFYGRGAVSTDTVGLARALREATVPGAAHIHFNGAGGNVAAGKYNDGLPRHRFELANRLAAGMSAAWDNAVRIPVSAADLRWRVQSVALPLNARLATDNGQLQSVLGDAAAPVRQRLHAARELAYVRRVRTGGRVDIGCLAIGPARILHMPGELFVEYQLAAQAMRPELFVCMAAYGDDAMCYIGTAEAYDQGGYECSSTCARVSPDVEAVLNAALCALLAEQ